MLPRLLVRLYVAVIALEIALLTWRYVTDPVDAAHPLSVALGWAGLGSMVVMLIYSVARRSRSLRRWAALRYWLHFHIFCGIQGVVFVFFHCLPILTRAAPVQLLNPGVVNALAVAVVFFSGLFGRYLYAMLPRAIRGEQLSAADAQAELAASREGLPAAVTALLDKAPVADGKYGLLNLLRADARARSTLRALRQLDVDAKVRSLVQRHVRLTVRHAALAMAQPWFELWIVAHRPIAAMMFVLSLLHVALSFLFGNA